MARKEKAGPPPSLVHLFEPPKGFRGCFGWVCGYSADAVFLDLAAERFTQLTAARRSHAGRISLAVMLDAGNPQIAPADTPGVLHLPPPAVQDRHYRLLHAKVAVLGFAHEQNPQHWRLRLIVSTGNWTGQTLEQSLDLAWRIDVESTCLRRNDDEVRLACADVRAAWSLLGRLREQTDTGALLASGIPHSESRRSMELLDQWVAAAGGIAGRARPRFFDSRKESLLKQLPALVNVHCSNTARNYIGMASGFFESDANRKQEVPTVLAQIVEHLQGAQGGERLLIARPEVDVFVNKEACQAVASSAEAIRVRGWKIRAAHTPDYMRASGRLLHAKFILSANWREGYDKCSSAWLYLGSGNLTGPGFTRRASSGAGNLEAGVVLSVKGEGRSTLPHVLPVQWESILDPAVDALGAGEPWELRTESYFAPPASYLLYTGTDASARLRYTETPRIPFEVLTPDGSPCPMPAEQEFVWTFPCPRQVRIRWTEQGETREAEVPVVDEFGRIAATRLQPLDLDGVWSQLENFPLPPADEELLQDQDPTGDGTRMSASVTQSVPAAYPVRAVMTLVENIAALQEQLHEADWTIWCMRLRQTLTLAGQCEIVQMCRGLKVNVLSPLREAPFRPDYALDGSTDAGRLYEEVLSHIEKEWQLAPTAVGETL